MSASTIERAQQIIDDYERGAIERHELAAGLSSALNVEFYVDTLIRESDRVEREGDDAEQDWTRPLIDKPLRDFHARLRSALVGLTEMEVSP